MKKNFAFAAVALMAASAMLPGCSGGKSASQADATDTLAVNNPLPIKFGDPFVLRASDGRYYMYGTSLSDGYEAFVSDDLQTWDSIGRVYQGAQEGQWNESCFWAPEVYERDGKYYMFYSANDRNNPNHEEENFKIGVAVADSPAGPFTDINNRPLFEPEYPVIDANVLFDDASGKTYLYFSRCCYKHPVQSEVADSVKAAGLYDEVEESWVYGVELKPDFSGIVGEPQLLLAPPTKLSDRQAEWESRTLVQGEAPRRWTEGSYIFRHGDTYYIMYSANAYFGGNYAVGYATAKSPMGPFVKADTNPVLSENASKGGEVVGTGHNMVFTLPSGQLATAYHGRIASDPKDRYVFISPMEIDSAGTLIVHGPSTGVTPIVNPE